MKRELRGDPWVPVVRCAATSATLACRAEAVHHASRRTYLDNLIAAAHHDAHITPLSSRSLGSSTGPQRCSVRPRRVWPLPATCGRAVQHGSQKASGAPRTLQHVFVRIGPSSMHVEAHLPRTAQGRQCRL